MTTLLPARSQGRILPAIDASDDSAQPEIRRGALALGAFFLIFIVGGALTPLDAAVVGTGRVTVSGNRQAVQHRDGGIVSHLSVREGQLVESGQVLLRVDTNELTSQERVLSRQTIAARMLEARLKAQIAGRGAFDRPAWMAELPERDQPDAESTYQSQMTEFRSGAGSLGAQVEVVNQRIAQTDSQLSGLTGQIESTGRQIDITRDQLVDIRQLYDKGLATLSRVRSLESSLAELEGRLSTATSERDRALGQKLELSEQQRELRAGRADSRAELLRQVQTELLTLEPKLIATRAQIDRAEVRATASGRVVGLSIFTEGGVISPGQTLMEIVPEGAPRVVEAQIRPQDAENVHPGQRAQIRFNVAHARRAPQLYGSVTTVSADQFVDERTGMAYFKVQAELPPSEIAKLEAVIGEEAELGPGVPADVVIPIRGRTALGYLVDPLRDALWRSFRED
jgi:HlyD family type I secretion membrane fusion protein